MERTLLVKYLFVGEAHRQHSAIGCAIWTRLTGFARANNYRRMAVHVGAATANAAVAVDLYRAMGAELRGVDDEVAVMDAMALIREGNVVGQHWWMAKW